VNILLAHKEQQLWLDSGVLNSMVDKKGFTKSLRTIFEDAQKWANKTFSDLDEYKHVYGMLGEVFAEFYLKRLGFAYGLQNIQDTSADQFFRGHDFLAIDYDGVQAAFK
jgi:hypothetical protein